MILGLGRGLSGPAPKCFPKEQAPSTMGRPTQGLKPNSIVPCLQKLQYFHGLVDFEEEPFSDVGFFVALYKTGLMAELLALPILNKALPTTRNVLQAVAHYCNFLLLTCSRNDLTDAGRYIKLLQEEIVGPAKKRAEQQRSAANEKKKDRDDTRLENLPPIEVLQCGIKEAMLDLNTLWLKHQAEPDLPRQLFYAANVIMSGLTFGNSYAGRPGEWAAVSRKFIEDFLASGRDSLVMQEHKTSDKYGDLGRWVPPGNTQAMKKLLDLHPSDTELFFAPTSKTGKKVSMSALLKKWAKVYTPGHQPPLPTLMRKFFHTDAPPWRLTSNREPPKRGVLELRKCVAALPAGKPSCRSLRQAANSIGRGGPRWMLTLFRQTTSLRPRSSSSCSAMRTGTRCPLGRVSTWHGELKSGPTSGLRLQSPLTRASLGSPCRGPRKKSSLRGFAGATNG